MKKRMKLTSSPLQNESAPGPLLSSTPRDRPISSQPISSQQGIKYGSEENGLPAPKKETPRRADSVKMQHRCHFLKCWISSLPFNLFWLCRIHLIILRYIDLEGRSVLERDERDGPNPLLAGVSDSNGSSQNSSGTSIGAIYQEALQGCL